jgi:chromosome segregation ATPase
MSEKSKLVDQEERTEAKGKGTAADKFDLNKMVEATTDRIAYLKRQHEDLQKQKADLEALSRQRQELDGGKREIVSGLERALAVLEREENDLQRKHALVQTTREEFKKALSELRTIREEEWAAENIKDEILSALAAVSRAKSDFSKAQGQIQALTARLPVEGGQPLPAPEVIPLAPEGLSARDAFLRALLFFLPAAVFALILILIFRLLR